MTPPPSSIQGRVQHGADIGSGGIVGLDGENGGRTSESNEDGLGSGNGIGVGIHCYSYLLDVITMRLLLLCCCLLSGVAHGDQKWRDQKEQKNNIIKPIVGAPATTKTYRHLSLCRQ